MYDIKLLSPYALAAIEERAPNGLDKDDARALLAHIRWQEYRIAVFERAVSEFRNMTP